VRCLSFTGDSMQAKHYWLVDVDGDSLPYLVWRNSNGMVGAKADGRGGFSSEVRLLSPSLAESAFPTSPLFENSIRFGPMRPGSALPDMVAMTTLGVVIAANNGHGFDPPYLIPQLIYPATGHPAWNPARAGKTMVLVDPTGSGSPGIVVMGNAGLLYSLPSRDGFTTFKPLVTGNGFDYWSSSRIYTSMNTTQIAGRTAISGWTPVGIAFSNFKLAGKRPAIDQFKVICNDCFLTLPGWQDKWQQSSRTAVPAQAGFADFKHTGAPQAYAIWGKALYVADITTLAGYR
jgi:hypothetical protein